MKTDQSGTTSGRRRRCWSAWEHVAGLLTSVAVMFAGTGAGDLASAAEGACVITPFMEVSIGPPVQGIIHTVHVERGDWIKQGQVLVTIESSVEEATVDYAKAKAEAETPLEQAETKLSFARRKLERALALHQSKSVSQQEVDEAQTEKMLAEVELRKVKEEKQLASLELRREVAVLKRHRIVSPLTGVVVDRLLSPGELARQDPILKLAQVNPLRVEVFAPLRLLGKLKPGMTAKVVPEGAGATPVTAKITVVNAVVDSASGTFGVRLELPNPNNALPAGLACKIDFQLAP